MVFFILQSNYAHNLVKKFGLDNTRQVSTPIGVNTKLSNDDGEAVDQHLYPSMVGGLLYLTSSHRDLSYSVDVCGSFNLYLKSHI